MSLHDINMAIHYANRLVFMKSGRVHMVCDRSEITEELIEEVYGVRVILHQTTDYPIVVPAQATVGQETRK